MTDVSAVADTGNVKQIDKPVNKINQSNKTNNNNKNKKIPPPPPKKKKLIIIILNSPQRGR